MAKIDLFSSRVSINMLFNVANAAIMAIVGFLMVPYYIGEFGLATYAILPLAISITTYFIAISDSLASAFTRFLVIDLQKGDIELANRTFSSSIFGLGKIMFMLLPLVVLVSFLSPVVFNIGPASAGDVQLLFLFILISSMMLSFSSALDSPFMAYNKMYIIYMSKILYCLMQVGLILSFFFFVGPSLPFIGFSYIISASVLLLILVVNIRRINPDLKVSYKLYDKQLLHKIGGLGLWAVITEMGSLLFIQASMIVVNLTLGSQTQGTFSIAANMISMINTACTALAVTAVPLIYRNYAEGDVKEMVSTLRFFTKFTGMVMAFPVAYVIVFAPQIIDLWLGGGYEDLLPIIYVMLPVQIAVCTTRSLVDIPLVYMRMKSVAAVTLLLGAFNILLAFVLVEFTDLEVFGVCIAWVVTVLSMRLVFYPLFASRLTSKGILTYASSYIFSYGAFLILIFVGVAVNHYYVLPSTWFAVFVTLIGGFMVYALVMVRFAFNGDERRRIATYMPAFVQKMFRLN